MKQYLDDLIATTRIAFRMLDMSDQRQQHASVVTTDCVRGMQLSGTPWKNA